MRCNRCDPKAGNLTVMRISVIGTGYLGATHAACMADLGHEVIGFDVDPEKVASLAAGTVPFHEPGLDQVLQRALSSGRLTFTMLMCTFSVWELHKAKTPTPPTCHRSTVRLTFWHRTLTGLA